MPWQLLLDAPAPLFPSSVHGEGLEVEFAGGVGFRWSERFHAAELRRGHVTPIVDESHVMLAMEGQPMPRPFAAYAPDTITVGSASKAFWGGLRVGWLRAPGAEVAALVEARYSLISAPRSSTS